ncbi:GIY-YIG nuclease family protein [Spongiimicrobium sp. 3-5]|uniref:GIY-YIG nuclease family protein n=1 Tax=Spongiimicrobium sp. 3-5 TaxID=3332596 RepID=UPI00398118A9
MDYVVYVLFSEKLSRYYCGQTSNLEKRLIVHNQGGKKYTSKGVPWKLVKIYGCRTRSEAVQKESKIKKRGIKRYLDEN